MVASWPSGKRAFVQPWRSAQQSEDAPLPYTIHAAVARSMLAVCHGEIILEKGEILCEKRQWCRLVFFHPIL
jgi:hypothetical protein